MKYPSNSRTFLKINSGNCLVHQGDILYSITAVFSLPSVRFLSLFTSTDDSQCRTLLINQGVWERTREYLLYLPINHKRKQMRTNLLSINFLIRTLVDENFCDTQNVEGWKFGSLHKVYLHTTKKHFQNVSLHFWYHIIYITWPKGVRK